MSGSALTVAAALQVLQDAGYRVTSPRRAVVEAVVGRDRHFTWADIAAQVSGSDRSVGRATVFRTLEVLEELNLIGRIHHPDGGQGYVVCPQEHHHHAICSRCGLVVNLPGCPLGSEVEHKARSAGIHLRGHRVELYGVCKDCLGEAVD